MCIDDFDHNNSPFADACLMCGETMQNGDPSYWDRNELGYYHAACLGSDRSYFSNEDGTPLKECDEIPPAFPYQN